MVARAMQPAALNVNQQQLVELKAIKKNGEKLVDAVKNIGLPGKGPEI